MLLPPLSDATNTQDATSQISWRSRTLAHSYQIIQRVSVIGAIAMTIALPAIVPVSALAAQPMTFEQLMDVGYRASSQGDMHTALINFQRALTLRPNHPYAAAAADNMAYYLEHNRVSARQWEIDQLESRLARATAASDWVCAAATLDELTMYTDPNSLNRERLIGQRGEVSGLLDMRLNHEAWSTVCATQRPIY